MKKTEFYFLFALVLSLFLVACSEEATTSPNGSNGSHTDNPNQAANYDYKPFDRDHSDKFSLGDLDNPYLVEIKNDYIRLAESDSSFSIDGTSYGVELTTNYNRYFLGIDGLSYSAFTNADFTTFSLNLKVTNLISSVGGSVTNDVTIPLNVIKAAHNAIYTWRDLQNIRENLTLSYEQMNDITFPEAGTGGLPAEGFLPIFMASTSTSFSGNYDGNNHTIKNFFIHRPNSRYVALFANTSGGSVTIKDLTIDVANITGSDNVGSVVGSLSDGTVTNVKAISTRGGAITASLDIVGGLVGNVFGDSKVFGSAEVNVVSLGLSTGGGQGTGGLVGSVAGDSEIIGHATGNVSGQVASIPVGGLVGVLDDPARVIGYATGNVSSSNSTRLGGLAGGGTFNNNNIGTAIGYWDAASTGQANSPGSAASASVSISSISNVFFENGIYEDRHNDITNQVFTNETFLMYFDLPGRDNAWPTLK